MTRAKLPLPISTFPTDTPFSPNLPTSLTVLHSHVPLSPHSPFPTSYLLLPLYSPHLRYLPPPSLPPLLSSPTSFPPPSSSPSTPLPL
ncbi:hypothetical protein E2C01_034231 [Portunus trituberculatus]|uniref:Uncharacterized protein n=1 Tax=Portunus trituberculatus TaxID=210409 RepID=A0A5B7F5L4_PORTR|nr:hypothetical protein [Portunus trituberculatus]